VISRVTDLKEYENIRDLVFTISPMNRLKLSLMIAMNHSKELMENFGIKISYFLKVCVPTLDSTPTFKHLTQSEV